MGRRTMNDLKIFARVAAIVIVLSWCAASSWAAQQEQPKQAAAAASASAKSRPQAHKAAKASVKPHRHLKTGMVAAKTKTPVQAAKSPVVVKKTAETPKASVQTPAQSEQAAAVAEATKLPNLPEIGHGRDPFAALIRASDPSDSHSNLPPGIAGLQVATVRLEGMVKTSDGLVAVVANPQDRVYFLHDGDHIYDGVVEKIGLDDITFRQQNKDAFGRVVDRDVSKRLYPIAGDEQ